MKNVVLESWTCDAPIHRNRTAHRAQHAASLVELLTSLSIAAIAATSLLGGLRGLSAAVEMQRAVAVVHDALEDARLSAFLRAETATVRVSGRALSVDTATPVESLATFELPRGFTVTHASRSGRVRFFGDGLSDNASIRIADSDSGRQSTIYIDSRGEIR